MIKVEKQDKKTFVLPFIHILHSRHHTKYELLEQDPILVTTLRK